MLLTLKEMIDRASRENYAIAAPNVCHELDARAALEAAEEQNAPIIFSVYYPFTPDIILLGSYLTRLAEKSKVPIALHLDHSKNFEQAIYAIRAGFTSIMIDRSTLPFAENVMQAKEIVKIAKAVGISVEAELGHVGDGTEYTKDRAATLTDPKLAKQFIEETGVDCLAVAIGNAHGIYIGTPKLEFDLLKEIKDATHAPLVLHGGSGSGDDNLAKACRMGINKVNLSTDLMTAAYQQIQSADLSGNNVHKLWDEARHGYKAKLKEYIGILGSKGKGWTAS